LHPRTIGTCTPRILHGYRERTRDSTRMSIEHHWYPPRLAVRAQILHVSVCAPITPMTGPKARPTSPKKLVPMSVRCVESVRGVRPSLNQNVGTRKRSRHPKTSPMFSVAAQNTLQIYGVPRCWGLRRLLGPTQYEESFLNSLEPGSNSHRFESYGRLK
jgi:hypothetical protein